MMYSKFKFSLLIFDLDNTIYDWYSAFLPAFYSMATVAADLLQCDREILLDQMKQVHIRHHDVEHPFSLFETDVVQRLSSKFGREHVWSLLDPAFHAFNRCRKENLKLYPGAIETLNALIDYGIHLIAYTDSKYYSAWGRVERLGLTNIFETVYCREKGISHWSNKLNYLAREPPKGKIIELPSHEAKPNPRVLTDIVRARDVPMSQVAYVGDSLAKDVLMAKRAHCFAIWAKYGAHTDQKMYEKLIKISHWSLEDIEREKYYAKEAKLIRPDFVCERSITDLLSAVLTNTR